MKQFKKAWILLWVCLLFACAGGNAGERKTSEPILKGMKEINKGTAWYQKGCYPRSLEHFLRAHALFVASDQQAGVAMSMNNIGTVYRAMGDFKSAILFFEESHLIYVEIKDHQGALQSLSNQAAALIAGGRLDEAKNTLDAAEHMDGQMDKSFEPIFTTRGMLLIKKGQFQPAEETLLRALKNLKPSNFSDLATVNFALGNLMFKTGRPQKAVAYYQVSLSADRATGFHKGMAGSLAALGSAYLSLEKNEQAVKYFKRAVKVYALMGAEKKVSEIMEKLVAASKQAGVDISITRHFVKRWLEGKALESPCE